MLIIHIQCYGHDGYTVMMMMIRDDISDGYFVLLSACKLNQFQSVHRFRRTVVILCALLI